MSQDEIQKCFNKLEHDRTLHPYQVELIQEHMEKVEKDGFKMDIEVPDNEVTAWDWVKPFLRKEEGNG